MLRNTTDVASILYPEISELLILLTHRENKKFHQYANPTHLNTKTVAYYNDNHVLNSAGRPAMETIMTALHDCLRLTQPRLITFVIDFNVGYSGLDLSPIPELIEHLETENIVAQVSNFGQEDKEQNNQKKNWNFAFTKTREEFTSALQSGKTAFRFILTGSGGDDRYDGEKFLLKISAAAALEKFSFEGIDCTRFITANYKAIKHAKKLQEKTGKVEQANTITLAPSPTLQRVCSTSPSPPPPSPDSELSSPSSAISISTPLSSPGNSPEERRFDLVNVSCEEELLRALTLAPRHRDSITPERKTDTPSPPRVSPMIRPAPITVSPSRLMFIQPPTKSPDASNDNSASSAQDPDNQGVNLQRN